MVTIGSSCDKLVNGLKAESVYGSADITTKILETITSTESKRLKERSDNMQL